MRTIRDIETAWIPLADGTRLAARLWLPADAGTVPAILEYLPYRRRDRHRVDDSFTHPYFAQNGYAAVRVDMRGAGDSDGIMRDEYTEQEWRDAVEVIGWIARQDWCSGSVGMIGLSWSGFNSLQIAALRPSPLKAIVTTCASDDRYADDMHYMGGCLLNDNLQYGATFFTWLATPPDPDIVGERWREMWHARLEAATPRAGEWLRHQTRDGYWKSGSVCEDYSRIEAAVLAVGGWADGYSNAVLRLMQHLTCPRKAVIGPWAHAYPHVATPGPRIDFLGLVVRWMDHWLKGIDNGVMDEPMVTAWIQESEPPKASYEVRAGLFVVENMWPSPHIQPRCWHFSGTGLAAEPIAAAPVQVVSPVTTGIGSGEWCPYGWGPDMPLDQRGDDSGSACFDSLPILTDLTLLGGAVVEVEIESNDPEAQIAVRLNDVSPDGASRRISYGLANLALSDDREDLRQQPARGAFKLRVRLNDVGYTVPAGHRMRLAVSNSYWPLAWPSPRPTRLTIVRGTIELPVRDSSAPRLPVPDLAAARLPEAMPCHVMIKPERGRHRIVHNLADGHTAVEVVRNLGAMLLSDVGLTIRGIGKEIYEAYADRPELTRSTAIREASLGRDGWSVRIATRSVLTADGQDFVLATDMDAFEGDHRVFTRSWLERIRRATAKGDR